MSAAAQNIIGLFLTADRDVLLFVMAIVALLTLAVVMILPGERRWHQHLSLGLLIYLGLFLVGHVVFTYVVRYPFAKLEVVTLTTDR